MIAEWLKALAAKPKDQSLVPETCPIGKPTPSRCPLAPHVHTQNKQKHKEENKSEKVARVYKLNIWETERGNSLL